MTSTYQVTNSPIASEGLLAERVRFGPLLLLKTKNLRNSSLLTIRSIRSKALVGTRIEHAKLPSVAVPSQARRSNARRGRTTARTAFAGHILWSRSVIVVGPTVLVTGATKEQGAGGTRTVVVADYQKHQQIMASPS